MRTDWLLCSYRLPREPSRLRLAIWRRAKRLGALLLHDTVWLLPLDAKTREDVDWLAEEIEERGGSVLIWEAQSLAPSQDVAIVQQFRDDANGRYAELAQAAVTLGKGARGRLTPERLERARQEFRLLERTLRLERRRDYFRAPGRQAAESALRMSGQALGLGTTNALTGGKSHVMGDQAPMSR